MKNVFLGSILAVLCLTLADRVFAQQSSELTSMSATLNSATKPSLQTAGGNSGGGGDVWVGDFVRVATQEAYSWIVKNGNKLNPRVDSINFLMALDPKNMASVERLFESCQVQYSGNEQSDQKLVSIRNGQNDREVSACFDGKTRTYVSQAMYPLIPAISPAKIQIIAHELFRKMGLPEGDSYAISSQMRLDMERQIVGCSVFIDQKNSGSPSEGLENIEVVKTVLVSNISKKIIEKGYSIVSDPQIAAYTLKYKATCPGSHSSGGNFCGQANLSLTLSDTITSEIQVAFAQDDSRSWIWQSIYETYEDTAKRAADSFKKCEFRANN